MERHIAPSFVSGERLAYLLTFVPQSFMAFFFIIIEIGENMCRGGVCTQYRPPPRIPMSLILQKKQAWDDQMFTNSNFLIISNVSYQNN